MLNKALARLETMDLSEERSIVKFDMLRGAITKFTNTKGNRQFKTGVSLYFKKSTRLENRPATAHNQVPVMSSNEYNH